MMTNHLSLPPLRVPLSVLSLPARPGLCQPVDLANRLLGLHSVANQQLKQAYASLLVGRENVAGLQVQSFVITSYQMLSCVVALKCWQLFQKQCERAGYILVDNLTGIMAPGDEVASIAHELWERLFATPEDRALARNIYQLTSALLHSYPHTDKPVWELGSNYRDLSGNWQRLGPWPPEYFVKGLGELLTAWMQSYTLNKVNLSE